MTWKLREGLFFSIVGCLRHQVCGLNYGIGKILSWEEVQFKCEQDNDNEFQESRGEKERIYRGMKGSKSRRSKEV